MRYENPMIKNQYFGVEVEFTGISRATAIKAMGEYFGRDTHYAGGMYNAETVKDAQNRVWKVVRDSSILTEGGYDNQCEMVTPKLRYEDMDTLQEVIRVLRHAGAKVNSSCGVHVHVDAANHNAKSLKNLIYIMRSKEDVIFKALAVNPNRVAQYCSKVDNRVFDEVRGKKVLGMDDLKRIWYNGNLQDAERHYSYTRYHALNLHNVWFRGTVEFRLFNGTLHAGKIRAYVCLALAISANAIASNHVTYSAPKWDRNEKELFEWWLIRLGLEGKEFKNVRAHLSEHLPTGVMLAA